MGHSNCSILRVGAYCGYSLNIIISEGPQAQETVHSERLRVRAWKRGCSRLMANVLPQDAYSEKLPWRGRASRNPGEAAARRDVQDHVCCCSRQWVLHAPILYESGTTSHRCLSAIGPYAPIVHQESGTMMMVSSCRSILTTCNELVRHHLRPSS